MIGNRLGGGHGGGQLARVDDSGPALLHSLDEVRVEPRGVVDSFRDVLRGSAGLDLMLIN